MNGAFQMHDQPSHRRNGLRHMPIGANRLVWTRPRPGASATRFAGMHDARQRDKTKPQGQKPDLGKARKDSIAQSERMQETLKAAPPRKHE